MNIQLGGNWCSRGFILPSSHIPLRVFENLLLILITAREWIGRTITGWTYPIDFIYISLWQNNKEFSYVFLIYFDFLYSLKKKQTRTLCVLFVSLDQTCLMLRTPELVSSAEQSEEIKKSTSVSMTKREGKHLKLVSFLCHWRDSVPGLSLALASLSLPFSSSLHPSRPIWRPSLSSSVSDEGFLRRISVRKSIQLPFPFWKQQCETSWPEAGVHFIPAIPFYRPFQENKPPAVTHMLLFPSWTPSGS